MSMPQTPEELKAFNRQLIVDFRAHDPKLKERRILLLTTTGARSGQPHTTPMTYVIDGDRVLVIASNAGAVRHPDWYVNLVANPAVTVELPAETFQTRAVVAEGADGDVGEVFVGEDVMDEIGADFAGSAGDEDAFHEG